MKKAAANLLCCLVLLSSCIGSTRHAAIPGGCPQALQANDRILVGVIPGLLAHRSHQLYQQLEQEFGQKGISTAYVAEQEYDLARQGIKPNPAPDSITLVQMRKAGYTYYLELAVGDVASGMGYARTSAQEQKEIQQGYGTIGADDSKATVHFKLHSTDQKKQVYTLATTTKLSGVTLAGNKHEDGYRNSSTVNLSTASLATDKALKKGVAELLKNCKVSQ
ncbi:hypothetical protein K3G39_11155 [Pontibacter sp. HSC-14F20]|uniref:hypothetical protein n=1 Tax=Pontibacter sp. HSC-14F20 TaxID=2864136 RepID=UPI001C72AFFD|nr:hypothetical protein [Pontibacter sp. HSC-14F20]MBX0333794.1 hypothetical protein [Pontibacter sp. HSC-14F20]